MLSRAAASPEVLANSRCLEAVHDGQVAVQPGLPGRVTKITVAVKSLAEMCAGKVIVAGCGGGLAQGAERDRLAGAVTGTLCGGNCAAL